MNAGILLVIVLIILLIASLGYTQWQLWQIKKQYGKFLGDSDAKTIETLINTYHKDVNSALGQLDELTDFIARMHINSKYSISKQALLRFNPFGDTGGDQSFVLALLDSHNNGVIISSVHARTGTRVYAKEIKNGLSKYNLSDEETIALQKALNHKKKQEQ